MPRRNTQNRWISPLFIAVVLIALSSCGSDRDEPIVVGFVGPLSGRFAEVGQHALEGVQIAVEQYNEAGGKNGRMVEIVVADDMDEADKLHAVLDDFIQRDITVAIGPMMSSLGGAVLEGLKGREILLMSPGIATNLLSGRDDLFLRISPVLAPQGYGIAAHALSMGHRRITVVRNMANVLLSEEILEAFRDAFEPYGGEITAIVDYVPADDTDYAALTTEVLSTRPDAVFLLTHGIDAGQIVQKMAQSAPQTAAYGITWAAIGDTLFIHGGRSVEGMILVNFAPPNDEPTAKFLRFSERYEARFDGSPPTMTLLGYDAAVALLSGIDDADELQPTAVREAIITRGNVDGLTEDYAIDEYGDAKRNYYLYEVSDGKLVPLKKID